MFRRFCAGALVLASLAVFGPSCSRNADFPNDPKKALSGYISRSFDVKSPSDRAQLISYLTGDARARLSAWSDEQFTQAFIDNRRQFVKLLFTETKSVSANEINITYELTYIDQAKGGHGGAKVTQKKMAKIVQDSGKWMIADVQSIKELVEYRNEMALP